jgi:hypothetical protein
MSPFAVAQALIGQFELMIPETDMWWERKQTP